MQTCFYTAPMSPIRNSDPHLGLVWLVGTWGLFYFPGFGRSTLDATFIAISGS